MGHSSLPGRIGGEADPAVAGDHRRHTVTDGRLEDVVPTDRAVVVGVDVEESRSDDLARRVDRLDRVAR